MDLYAVLFSLLDLTVNSTCAGMNFTHLT